MAVTVMGTGFAPSAMAAMLETFGSVSTNHTDLNVKDYLIKMQSFNRPHPNDIYLDPEQYLTLKSSMKRLKRLQRTVGYGNFHLLNFDEALKIARNYANVGGFSREELDFLEEVFYGDASRYGFFGAKPIKNLTDRVSRREVARLRSSGHFLYKGLPMTTYKKIKRDIGDEVILTSGVRSVMKQFLLFLDRAYKSKGNLSIASRSLAPPGYSFHGIGDFDVGQVGYGYDNFTARFATTDVFKKLQQLGYIDLRYIQDNMLGVRFEPWHIKVNFHT